jgi:adenylate cyclase
VEIAATAFANLLERRAVTPLSKPLHFLVIALWGMALGALFLSLPAAGILLTAGAFAAAYMVGACYAFAHSSSWIPVVVPLLVQMPAAVVSGLLWQYLDTRRERQKIRETFSHYLPRSVVDDLTDGSGHIETTGHRVYAVCLHSDAGGYTPLSETLNADELFALLNRFFQPILEQVTRRGGSVSDIIGDGMLAIWPALPPGAKPRELRQQACHAALDIIDAVDEFNRGTGEARLPARVGLHCGEVRMGSVGAADHFEYRAVGDTVNTAERIQRLNKEMKTRVIASREAVEGLEAIVTRELGSFRLEGKANPLAMHELVCRAGQLDAARSSQYADFAAALEAFRTQRWHSGANAFRNVIDQYGEDGPARYYLGRCEQYLRRPPPAPWDGVVTLGPKQERLGAT